jgi:hypothetical protein
MFVVFENTVPADALMSGQSEVGWSRGVSVHLSTYVLGDAICISECE